MTAAFAILEELSASPVMLRDLIVALFVTAAGMTASGIVANLYRLLVGPTVPVNTRGLYLAVMVVAGPSVLFDNAARSRRKKECSYIAFFLAAALALYWSLAIGLFVVAAAITI